MAPRSSSRFKMIVSKIPYDDVHFADFNAPAVISISLFRQGDPTLDVRSSRRTLRLPTGWHRDLTTADQTLASCTPRAVLARYSYTPPTLGKRTPRSCFVHSSYTGLAHYLCTPGTTPPTPARALFVLSSYSPGTLGCCTRRALLLRSSPLICKSPHADPKV